VQKETDETPTCYKEIYEETKQATVLSSLDKFVREIERPEPPPA
jgi:hypothetical protein